MKTPITDKNIDKVEHLSAQKVSIGGNDLLRFGYENDPKAREGQPPSLWFVRMDVGFNLLRDNISNELEAKYQEFIK